MSEIVERRGRGRPAGNVARKKQYRLRMDDDMNDRLDNLCMRTGMSRADIFREGFNLIEKLKLAQLPDEDENEFDGYYGDDFDDV
jgi:hypothetical protein